jgi:hypothetical protein
MQEVWLRNNRRALYLGMILPGVWLAIALGAFALALVYGLSLVTSGIALLLGLPAVWMLGGLAYALSQPRVAYEPGELIVYTHMNRATRLPIDVVEVFFSGQGDSELPKLAGREPETRNIVIRLAEAASEWKHGEIHPAIGHWCDGYITIRGAWCEPIEREVFQRLNHRLAEIHRERKTERAAQAAAASASAASAPATPGETSA